MKTKLLGCLFLSWALQACAPASNDKNSAGAAGAAGSTPAGSGGSTAGAPSAGAGGGAGGEAAGQAGNGASGEAGQAGQAGGAGQAGQGEAGLAGSGGTGGAGEGGASQAGAGQAGAGAGGAGQAGAGEGGASQGGAAGEAGAAGAAAGSGGAAGSDAQGGAAGTDAGGASQGGAAGEAGQGGAAGGGGSGQTWEKLASPCAGNKINALWFDDPLKGFAGCGELAAGKGLHATTDGGKTWKAHPKFNEVRVVDIRRGPDGVLYGAGTHTVEGAAAWTVDESAPLNLKPVGIYTPSNQAFVSVPIGENIVRTGDGKILVDSLTGGSSAFQAPGKAFTEHYSLDEALIADPDAVVDFAPRKIIALGNDFYATGNKINEPARVFLPTKKAGGDAYYFERIELQASNLDGEPYDMHAWSPTSMIVVGWDRSYNYPLIFVADGDPYQKTSWKQVDLLDSGLEWQGGAYGLSADGDTVVVVGHKLPGDFGFILESKDRGKTWSEITPEGKPEILWKVQVLPGGKVLAAGGGELWVRGG